MQNVNYKCENLRRNRHIGDAMFITDHRHEKEGV